MPASNPMDITPIVKRPQIMFGDFIGNAKKPCMDMHTGRYFPNAKWAYLMYQIKVFSVA